MRQPVFTGLIVDEFDHPVEITYVGDEPCYVVNDAGFHRHIPSEYVDQQVLDSFRELIRGHEAFISEQTAKMLGQEDIFSRAMIEKQLSEIEKHFDKLLEIGIPEESRAYLGMMGFRIRINLHGEVLEIIQPGVSSSEDE
ncbi:MAG: hypothetical protein AB1345_02020 [Chloroflexota bacterium]